jgi:two-component system, chemotaxis family, CheB/CheR fusion protein
LRVIAANTAFYRLFQTVADATVGQCFYDLGNGQWNIPKLRELLEQILPKNSKVDNFIVDHAFPRIGLKKMTINALRIHHEGIGTETILLTIKNITGND